MIETSTPQAAREQRTPVARVKFWFSEDVFRRLFINAGKAPGASSQGTILALVTTTLPARYLGAAGFGTLARAVRFGQAPGAAAAAVCLGIAGAVDRYLLISCKRRQTAVQ